ncbi:hypothetical protein [Opitutus terrae]|uniref:Uncharacterized protein n=1 Tax=Opitutus terrae (strain DSM 11246 / JCM 15787 / PB90-1) TaxID=452637 RepID=B1ZYZ8_OPITP|nr:hypothetical protein [Opitutus terrae]ACB76321.1 hypothetical protein Oter_3041 [Opitutus terrae PB90-1]
MKKLLSLSALFVLAGYAVVDLAKFSGAALPSVLNAGNAFVLFATLGFALLLHADYGRKVRPIPLPVRAKLPRWHSVAVAQRHVYAIRRGVEAARLAPAPSRVVVFPRRVSSRHERAA